ncbi:hypothetical protein [Marinobacterium nitratireducens]|nr:hypothetical protein [Marinobacterium nitratireducens]
MIIEAWTLDWFITLNITLLILTVASYARREFKQADMPSKG